MTYPTKRRLTVITDPVNKKVRFDKNVKDILKKDKNTSSDDEIFTILNIKGPNNTNTNTNTKIKQYVIPCSNPVCDHIFNKEKYEEFMKTPVVAINNVTDLINLGKTYHCKNNFMYHGIDLSILNKLVQPLTELNSLIGMMSVKVAIVDHIVFFLQNLNSRDRCNDCVDCTYNVPCKSGMLSKLNSLKTNTNNDMLHTVITGPPGVGKTELGKILSKVYKAMGVLSKGDMYIATRSDLIGKYLGHTAALTQAFINKCKGSVMFIDEAYSLGNPEGKDTFSKECIDTINQNLSENRDFLCIIAGYKDSLNQCFFSYNPGLERRFPFRYDITGYTGPELAEIFFLKIKKEGWVLDTKDPEIKAKIQMLFFTNMMYFAHFGGDIETLFLNCKIVHGRRQIFKDPALRKILTLEDIAKGFENYKNSKISIKAGEIPDSIKWMFM